MSADSHARRLAGNAVWNLLPFGLGFILNVVAIRLVVDRMGISDFGLFGLLAVVLAPLTLANLGFGEATIKFVAAAAAIGDLGTAGRFVRSTLAMNLLVGLLGGGLLVVVAPPLAVRFFGLPAADLPRVAVVLRWVALGWVGNQVAAVFLGVPPAFQRFRLVAAGHAVGQTALAVLGVVGAYLGGLTGYAAGMAAGAWVAAGCWWVIARGLLPGISLLPGIDRATWRRSFHFGGWQALAQLGALGSNQGERILLGLFLTPAAVGYYNVAQSFEQKIYSVVYKLSEVLFPHFSATEHVSLERKTDQLLRASWLLTALAVVALAPLIPVAHPLLVTWISPEAADRASPVMQVLAFGGILGCASNASLFFLLGNGATRGLAGLNAITGVVTIGVAWWVLPRYGLAAAGVAGAAAMVAQQGILTGVLLPRVLGASWSRLGSVAILYAPVLAGLALAILVTEFGPTVDGGWGAVGLGYLCVATLVAGAVWGIGQVTPGRVQRSADLRATVAPFLRLVRRGA